MACRDEIVKQSAKQHALENKKAANKCDFRSPEGKAAARTSKRLTNGRGRKERNKEWQHGAVSGDGLRAVAQSVFNSGRVDKKTQRDLWKVAYLECHGTHIILLCEGEKARGAARTAVK
jgi:hypothetical protein